MKNAYLLTIKYGAAALLLLATNTALAQGLPNVQKKPVFLTGVKIDGQALETKHKFEAYNKAIDAFYTLANDDNNLYLTLRVKYGEIIPKVLLGGITLTVNHSKAKRDTAGLSVTFPFLETEDRGKMSNSFVEAENKKKELGDKDYPTSELNAVLKSVTKTIEVEGLHGLKTARISIYNEEGIRAASMFDGQLLYTYELAIPLKLLALLNNGSEPFSYRIKVNSPMEASTTAPTDFWAEYKLVKK
jgi:hypothetical protein